MLEEKALYPKYKIKEEEKEYFLPRKEADIKKARSVTGPYFI